MKEREIRIKENAKMKIVATKKEVIIEDRDRFGELRRYVHFDYDELDAILKELKDMGIIENEKVKKEVKNE